MRLCDKLNYYFENTGVQKKWLSVRMGMDPHQFYQVLRGDRYLPQCYWKPLIELTNGKITMKDLLEDCLRDVAGLNIEGEEGKISCHVSLKEINNTESVAV